MKELIASIPLWGAAKSDMKFKAGNFSFSVSGASGKFARSYRLVWAVAKKASARKDGKTAVSVSTAEGKSLCGGLREFRDTVKALAKVRVEMEEWTGKDSHRAYFSPFANVQVSDEGAVIRLEPIYAEACPEFLRVFSKAGDSESNVMATRMVHVLKSLASARIRNLPLPDFASLLSGYADSEAASLAASAIAKYGVSQNGTSLDVFATGLNLRNAAEGKDFEANVSQSDAEDAVGGLEDFEAWEEEKKAKRELRERIFEKYAELAGIRKESFKTAYFRFAKPLKAMSDEISKGAYDIGHVMEHLEAWNSSGLSWTLETMYKNVSYPADRIRGYGVAQKRSGTTGYSDTEDRSYIG